MMMKRIQGLVREAMKDELAEAAANGATEEQLEAMMPQTTEKMLAILGTMPQEALQLSVPKAAPKVIEEKAIPHHEKESAQSKEEVDAEDDSEQPSGTEEGEDDEEVMEKEDAAQGESESEDTREENEKKVAKATKQTSEDLLDGDIYSMLGIVSDEVDGSKSIDEINEALGTSFSAEVLVEDLVPHEDLMPHRAEVEKGANDEKEKSSEAPDEPSEAQPPLEPQAAEVEKDAQPPSEVHGAEVKKEVQNEKEMTSEVQEKASEAQPPSAPPAPLPPPPHEKSTKQMPSKYPSAGRSKAQTGGRPKCPTTGLPSRRSTFPSKLWPALLERADGIKGQDKYNGKNLKKRRSLAAKIIAQVQDVDKWTRVEPVAPPPPTDTSTTPGGTKGKTIVVKNGKGAPKPKRDSHTTRRSSAKKVPSQRTDYDVKGGWGNPLMMGTDDGPKGRSRKSATKTSPKKK
jgi:hypothetical protein